MHQRSYRSPHTPDRGTTHYKSLALLVIGVAVFFGGISWFRHQSNGPVADTSTVTENQVISIVANGQAPIRRDREEATVYNVDHVGLAIASREVQDHTFHHTLVAHLSDPSEGWHYQGWLVRAEPFDFFTTGSMDKNADGTFALIWDGPFGKDYDDYNEIVVTLERDGGDEGPSLHILEGTF